jgi:PsbP-like protein
MIKIAVVPLFVSIISFGQNVKQEPGTKTTSIIKDAKTLSAERYSIQYPSDWELNQNELMGTSFILFSALETGDDLFRENVNLLIQDLSTYNMDLNQYTEISEGQVKTMITNSSLIESKRIKIGSEEYHRMIYTGDRGIFHLQFEQYYWVRNNEAYILTFTSEQDKFSRYSEIGEAILNSFVFK